MIVYRIKGRFFAAIRSFYNKIRGNNQIELIRNEVKKRLGESLLKKASKTKIVIYPNNTKVPKYIFKRGYTLPKILLICNQIPVFNPHEECDVFVNWEDITVNTEDPTIFLKYPPEGASKPLRINFKCNDISKRKIEDLNHKIFGYHLGIDPLVYHGPAVCKSNDNAAHNGKIVECPIDFEHIDEHSVYELLVDNSLGDYVYDYRLIYMDGLLEFFYEKKRPCKYRFLNTNTSVKMRKLSDEFSEDEIIKINLFCKELGADFGELDVIRDAKSQNIYIVDFAKTPSGPPNGLSEGDSIQAIVEITIAYLERIIKAS